MSMRPVPGSRPGTFIVRYRDFPFELDTIVCRRALAESQVACNLDSPEALARAAGLSRSTVSRFFSGHQTSLRHALLILGMLNLRFEDVARPVEPGPNGSVGGSR